MQGAAKKTNFFAQHGARHHGVTMTPPLNTTNNPFMSPPAASTFSFTSRMNNSPHISMNTTRAGYVAPLFGVDVNMVDPPPQQQQRQHQEQQCTGEYITRDRHVSMPSSMDRVSALQTTTLSNAHKKGRFNVSTDVSHGEEAAFPSPVELLSPKSTTAIPATATLGAPRNTPVNRVVLPPLRVYIMLRLSMIWATLSARVQDCGCHAIAYVRWQYLRLLPKMMIRLNLITSPCAWFLLGMFCMAAWNMGRVVHVAYDDPAADNYRPASIVGVSNPHDVKGSVGTLSTTPSTASFTESLRLPTRHLDMLMDTLQHVSVQYDVVTQMMSQSTHHNVVSRRSMDIIRAGVCDTLKTQSLAPLSRALYMLQSIVDVSRADTMKDPSQYYVARSASLLSQDVSDLVRILHQCGYRHHSSGNNRAAQEKSSARTLLRNVPCTHVHSALHHALINQCDGWSWSVR